MSETYHQVLIGEKPMEALKGFADTLKVRNPNHPLLKAKGAELVAVPDGMSWTKFKDDFIKNSAESNKLYIAILKMGTEIREIDEIQMTGKCRTNENVAKGVRKWDTVYVVYTKEGKEIKILQGKTEAMQFAKQYAMDNDCDVYVELEKRLNGSLSRIADISPIKKHVKEKKEVIANQFLFFGRSE